MNAQRKKSAVIKYQPMYKSGLTPEELKNELAKDEKAYPEAEIAEILEAIINPAPVASGATPPEQPQPGTIAPAAPAAPAPTVPLVPNPPINAAPAAPPEAEPVVDSSNPNAALDLNSFDYDSLTHKGFKDYEAFVNSLPLEKQYDFVEMKVDVVIEDMYPGLPNSPKEFRGIKLTSNIPVKSTRVPVRHIINLNQQVRNTRRYFLLKK